MAKRKVKKPPQDMTNEELEKYVFPKKVRDELQRIAHENDDPDKEETGSSHE